MVADSERSHLLQKMRRYCCRSWRRLRVIFDPEDSEKANGVISPKSTPTCSAAISKGGREVAFYTEICGHQVRLFDISEPECCKISGEIRKYLIRTSGIYMTEPTPRQVASRLPMSSNPLSTVSTS